MKIKNKKYFQTRHRDYWSEKQAKLLILMSLVKKKANGKVGVRKLKY